MPVLKQISPPVVPIFPIATFQQQAILEEEVRFMTHWKCGWLNKSTFRKRVALRPQQKGLEPLSNPLYIVCVHRLFLLFLGCCGLLGLLVFPQWLRQQVLLQLQNPLLFA